MGKEFKDEINKEYNRNGQNTQSVLHRQSDLAIDTEGLVIFCCNCRPDRTVPPLYLCPSDSNSPRPCGGANREGNTSESLRHRAILDFFRSPFNVVFIQLVDKCNFIAAIAV